MTATKAKTDKGYRGVGMEGPIARWYARTVRRDGDAIADQLAQVEAYAPDTGDVLEVAPGPGYLAVELARTGRFRVSGLDISETFVTIARANAAEAGVDVDVRHGNASAMPYDDASFDLVVCCAAFKNFSAPVDALREMYRVLRPGGTAVVVDLRRDVSRAAVDEEVARLGLSGVNRAVTRFILGSWLPRRAYTRAGFEELLAQAAIPDHEVRQTRLSLEVVLRKPPAG